MYRRNPAFIILIFLFWYNSTIKERKNPKLLMGSASRKSRIAKGSGSTVNQVNKLIKDFENMSKMMKQFKGMAGKGKFGKKGFFPKLPF